MAKLNAHFHEKDVGRIISEFQEFLGRDPLLRAVDRVYTEIKRRNIISEALLRRYAIPLGLRKAVTYRQNTGRNPNPLSSPELYSACTFAASIVELAKALSEKGRNRLLGMVRDGLTLDGDARRLQHELTATAHFSLRGWDIESIDLEERGNFDFVIRKDGVEVDVECKTVSGDIGNAIHQVEALNFMETVYRPLFECVNIGCLIVDLTFPGRLPRNEREQLALAEQIVRNARERDQVSLPDGCLVTISHEELPAIMSRGNMHSYVVNTIARVQSRLNGHVGAVYNSRRVLVLGVSSLQESKVIISTYESVKKGCEQLSKNRPGHVWTHFLDLTNSEMQMLSSAEAPTGIDYISARIFRSDQRRHVSTLSYSAEGELQPAGVLIPSVGGKAFGKQGILPTHHNQNALFPLVDFP